MMIASLLTAAGFFNSMVYIVTDICDFCNIMLPYETVSLQ